MGKRDRERKARVLSGMELPHIVRLAPSPLRMIMVCGRWMGPPWDTMETDTRAEIIEAAFGHIRAMGLFPKVEEDDGDSVTVGMYCIHGNADMGIELSEGEEGGWFVAQQEFMAAPFQSSCSCVGILFDRGQAANLHR
jgi:hypothetical protein